MTQASIDSLTGQQGKRDFATPPGPTRQPKQMTGGRRDARNRRQRAELLALARAYGAVLHRATALIDMGRDGLADVERERDRLATQLRGIEGRS